MRSILAGLAAALLASACSNNGRSPSPVESIPQTDHIRAPSLSAPVDVVRDEWGIPHIYGATFGDVAFAEGYLMAQDRLIQMDLIRHNADGTVAELAGDLSPSLVDGDINMRVHHLRRTAQASLDLFKASSDPDDQATVAVLGTFAAGINAYLADLKSGRYSLPGQVAIFYNPQTTRPWTEVDSLMLLNFQFFFFGYSNLDLLITELEAKAKMVFDQSMDPLLAARKGIGLDLHLFAAIDPTHTIAGWTGMNGDTTTASLAPPDGDAGLLALLAADRPSLARLGALPLPESRHASNNWVIGPPLSSSGHVLVANDTHVPLNNPPIWYLVHLVVSDPARPIRAMGVNFPGLPGIALGMNEHVAWGATTSQIDQSDFYQETIVTCDDGSSPCVMFNGKKVALAPRTESFGVGTFGKMSHTINATFYDVPHHGPILPRINRSHGLEALGSTELSVKYTGYAPSKIARVALGFATAKTMTEWVATLDQFNVAAAFNWVIGDDQGNFGWTERVRVPRRAPGFAPWKVLPGDGSAEWGEDMDPKFIPHAFNPASGFIATANNDPIGVTDDGDPFFDEPMVADGARTSPLYLAFDYVDGARIGRITKRITQATAGGGKLSLDDMSAIQADAVSEYAQLLAPTFLDAAKALAEEMATPGAHPDVAALAAGASAAAKAALPTAASLVMRWTSFDTPAAMAEEQPTAAQVADSQAAAIVEAWIPRLTNDALGDEVQKLGLDPGSDYQRKLIVRMCTRPDSLTTGLSPSTGDPVLFDDLGTPAVESKRQIAARAILETLDYLSQRLGADVSAWRWGQLHTLVLEFLSPMPALRVPLGTDRMYPDGFPRHGTVSTPDVGAFGLDGTDFKYRHGPGIRFVCELDPKQGPRARNVLPGGEVFDPGSPHYRDQMELWRKNQTFDLEFRDEQVLAGAMKELAAHMDGRVRFEP